VSGSGISCQHPTAQFFTGRMPFLPPKQQYQSTEASVDNKQSVAMSRSVAVMQLLKSGILMSFICTIHLELTNCTHSLSW